MVTATDNYFTVLILKIGRTDLRSLSQSWRGYAVTLPTICNLASRPDPGPGRQCAEIGMKKLEWGGSLVQPVYCGVTYSWLRWPCRFKAESAVHLVGF